MTNEEKRELLELAAKAVGLRVTLWEGHCGIMCATEEVRHGRMWMPLDDDGDALRLAVKLNLWRAIGLAHRLLGGDGAADMYAATRLAIVRAAAEIGKSMPVTLMEVAAEIRKAKP